MAVVANQAVAFDKSMLMACPHLGDVLRPGLILDLTGYPEVMRQSKHCRAEPKTGFRFPNAFKVAGHSLCLQRFAVTALLR
jgi:hypothetical protein